MSSAVGEQRATHTGPRVLILDHVLLVDGKPVHGPGLNTYSTLRRLGAQRIEYLGHCLEGRYRAHRRTCARGGKAERIRPSGLPLRCLVRPLDFVYAVSHAFCLFAFKRHELCVAVNPLNFVAGWLLRCCGRVGKVVFYTADYSDVRFGEQGEGPSPQPLYQSPEGASASGHGAGQASPRGRGGQKETARRSLALQGRGDRMLNAWYHRLDRFAVMRADQNWGVSKAICDLRESFLPSGRVVHVPNSPVLSQFRPLPATEIARSHLVYVFGKISEPSVLLGRHHFDWLLPALQDVAARYPEVRLRLIGRGDFKPLVEPLIPAETLSHRIDFLDIVDREVLVETLCRAGIGVALYDLSGSDHLKYGDSMKIREYFAAGLPAITTPGHSVAEEIAEHELGFVVRNRGELEAALDTLLGDAELYGRMRQRVLEYAEKTDKERVISEALRRLLEEHASKAEG